MNEQTERRGPGRPPKYHEAVGQAANLGQTYAGTAQNALGSSGLSSDAQVPVARPVRKPFGSINQKLAYADRAGYHRHFFNDAGNRIHDASAAGYSHVKNAEDGRNVERVVGTAEGGTPLVAYLMETPEEWYKADMAAQQAEIDAKEDTMRRGADNQLGANGYVPQQGISIKHGK